MSEVNFQEIEIFLTKIKTDSEFAEKTLAANEPAEVQTIAQDAGIELTMDDIMASKELLMKAIDKANQTELTDDDLEDVSGGVAITTGGIIATAAVVTTAISAISLVPPLVDSICKNKW